MNPQQTPPRSTDEEAWFNSIPSQSPLPKPPRKPQNHTIIWIALIIVIVIISMGVVVAFLLTQPTEQRCLTSSDLSDLVETKSSETGAISPESGLFTYSVNFSANTTKLKPSSEAETTKYLKSIGAFYTKNSASASIVIELQQDYFGGESSDITQERLAFITARLTEYGVPKVAIKQAESEKIPNTSGESTTPLPLFITVTSTKSSCEDSL